VRRRLAAVLAVVALAGVACGDDGDNEFLSDDDTTATTEAATEAAAVQPECPPATPPAEAPREFAEAPPTCTDDGVDYGATITTSEGVLTVDLDEEAAPETVNNFVFLARWGWYDGDDFHRVINGFMAQAGDPYGEPQGTGGPGYTIEDELPSSADPYAKGTLAMANTGMPNSAGSQWFVCWACSLPPSYAVFGHVVGGMDVLEKINALGNPGDGPPTKAITITSIRITEA
jgi:cyclophilin family peptidyl-prolyl cis-trans isomerase